MDVNHGGCCLFKFDTLNWMSQQEFTNFFDVHFLALHNKDIGLPVFNSATHHACVWGREGSGEVPSHFELIVGLQPQNFYLCFNRL